MLYAGYSFLVEDQTVMFDRELEADDFLSRHNMEEGQTYTLHVYEGQIWFVPTVDMVA